MLRQITIRTLIFTNLIIVLQQVSLVVTAPSTMTQTIPDHNHTLVGSSKRKNNSSSEVERSLEQFLGHYYDERFGSSNNNNFEDGENVPNNRDGDGAPLTDIYETMQGDQSIQQERATTSTTISGSNISDIDYIRAMRNRTRDNWIQVLKENILRQIGRDNSTMLPKPDERLSSLNISDFIPGIFNTTVVPDDNIGERIRSFYPSCDIPMNTDQDAWKEDDVMNLYFNFDHSENRNSNIATATLRLYRLPDNVTKSSTKGVDCDSTNTNEDEKLLRISIYWYTKSLKKRRMKRRLSDSKVITESTRWVDLSVKPATKAWFKGKNLGLGVLVEDQEGNTLKASRFFKGASCMVGTSTPKPIPTIIIDAARHNHELNHHHDLFGRNTTSALYSDVQLLPTIDICTLEFPENYTQPPHIMSLRINACNLKKMHEQGQMLAERERRERLGTLVEFTVPNLRHIRHQRQHLANKMGVGEERGYDPRSGVVGSIVVMRNTDLKNNNFNLSTSNR